MSLAGLPSSTARKRFEQALNQGELVPPAYGGTAKLDHTTDEFPQTQEGAVLHTGNTLPGPAQDMTALQHPGAAPERSETPPRAQAAFAGHIQTAPVAQVPYALPHLTLEEAQARSLIARNVRLLPIQMGGTPWEISIEPIGPDAVTGYGPGDWQISAQWAGAPFRLRLPGAAADQWLRARFASLDLPQLPPPIRAAAFEAAVQDMLAALEGAGRGPAQIDSMEEAGDGPAADLPDQHLRLTMASGARSFCATLSTDSPGLLAMGGLAALASCAPGPLSRAGVPVLLRAEMGTATLTRAELKSLQPGDAIMLVRSWVNQDGQFWLGHGGWGLCVRAEGPHLVVSKAFHSKELEMDDDIDDGHGTDAPHDELPVGLDDIPVHVKFDLGHITMTLKRAGELQVGEVLELSRPLSQAVTLRANGALVGTGTLIDIGGQIAVSITSLGPRRGDGQ